MFPQIMDTLRRERNINRLVLFSRELRCAVHSMEDVMIPFLLHTPVFSDEPLENVPEHVGQEVAAQVQLSPTIVPRFPFTNPDAERSLPYPLLLRFLTISPAVNGDQTLCETKTETGDGKGPTTQDSADDEDVTNDPDDPGTAYVIADSNDKEDADY